MTYKEQDGRSPYRQFAVGDDLSLTLNKLDPDGLIATRSVEARIEAIKGGGFFGQVLVLQDLPFVLKTSITTPLRDFLRRLNWGARDFPYQVDERHAQLGQIKTDLIHDAVFAISQGKYYAPKSFGYTQLPGTFAQAVERLYGRPPRYDNHRDEFRLFREAQVELTGIAYRLGFEHVGQIHPDNPFAMANLWWNPILERFEWFDTLPAIPHNGWVWPPCHFGFHDEIRRIFYPDTKRTTFDKIHTGKFLWTIEHNRELFDDAVLERIQDNITLYEKLMAEKNSHKSTRNYPGLAIAGRESAIDFGKGCIAAAKGALRSPIELITNPPSLDEIVLRGVEKALDTGTITKQEFQEAISVMQDLSSQQGKGRNKLLNFLKDFPVFSGLYAYYHVSGALLKPFELVSYAAVGLAGIIDKDTGMHLDLLFSHDDWQSKLVMGAGVFVGFRTLGGFQSFLATKLISLKMGRNLDAAAIVSAIPIIGIHLAIPAQISVDGGSKSREIWHNTARNIIAGLSKISPSGGWGSELEGRLWNLLGRRLEGLAKPQGSR